MSSREDRIGLVDCGSQSGSACGHASTRPWEAAAQRQRQFALGVGPQRQWKKVGRAARHRVSNKRRPIAIGALCLLVTACSSPAPPGAKDYAAKIASERTE